MTIFYVFEKDHEVYGKSQSRDAPLDIVSDEVVKVTTRELSARAVTGYGRRRVASALQLRTMRPWRTRLLNNMSQLVSEQLGAFRGVWLVTAGGECDVGAQSKRTSGEL